MSYINTVYIVRGHLENAGFVIIGVFGMWGSNDAYKLKEDTERDPKSGFYAVTVSEWIVGETRDERIKRRGDDE